MSDTFPFAAGEAADDDASPARRRPALLAAGGLGVAALAVLGVLALSGPGEDDLELGLPTGAPAAAAVPEPSASPTTPSPTAAPAVVTTAGRAGRDPFRGPGAGSTAGTAGTPDAAGGGEGTAPAPEAQVPQPPLPQRSEGDSTLPPVDPPAPAPVTGRELGDEPAGLRSVSLLRVTGDQTAVLAVDGTSQTVRVGDDFGPGGALLLLSLQQGPGDGQWTAVVQRGSGDPFDVVTGQPASLA